MDNKERKNISISLNKDVLKKINELTTHKARLIEWLLVEHLNKFNIKTDDIIL